MPTRRALFLVLLLAAGLFTMHTIGHLGTHHAVPVAASPHRAQEHEPAPSLQMPSLHIMPAPHDPGAPIAPLMVCVAILLTLVTLVFGLTLLARLDLRGLLHKPAGLGIPASGRAPPVPRIGLLIADLSILRT